MGFGPGPMDPQRTPIDVLYVTGLVDTIGASNLARGGDDEGNAQVGLSILDEKREHDIPKRCVMSMISFLLRRIVHIRAKQMGKEERRRPPPPSSPPPPPPLLLATTLHHHP